MRFSRDVVVLLKKTIAKEGWIDLPSIDSSMYPLIQKGDVCRFSPVHPEQLKKGDIILVWSENGEMMAHRFYYSTYEDSKRVYVCKGDVNLSYDKAVNSDRVIGKLKAIKRKQRYIYLAAPSASLWGRMIQGLPLLSVLLRKYITRRGLLV